VTSSETETVAVALAELRGEITTGLARIEGSLAVLVERSQRAERDIAELRSDTEGDIADLRREIDMLKARRWPLPVVGALTGIGALLVSVWSGSVR